MPLQLSPWRISRASAVCSWVSRQLDQRRWGSSASGGGVGSAAGSAPQPLPLKAALKALFLKVHPDLFADWPAEQVCGRQLNILYQAVTGW